MHDEVRRRMEYMAEQAAKTEEWMREENRVRYEAEARRQEEREDRIRNENDDRR